LRREHAKKPLRETSLRSQSKQPLCLTHISQVESLREMTQTDWPKKGRTQQKHTAVTSPHHTQNQSASGLDESIRRHRFLCILQILLPLPSCCCCYIAAAVQQKHFIPLPPSTQHFFSPSRTHSIISLSLSLSLAPRIFSLSVFPLSLAFFSHLPLFPF